MKKGTIKAVIIIGVFSIISVLIVQILWIKRAVHAQNKTEVLLKQQDSLYMREFDKSVRISLRSAIEEIQMCDSAVEIDYGAVREQSPNFFLVNVNEQLDPYYLEKLLERTFDANNVHQTFQYTIYDCFKDSLTHGALIQYSKDSLYKRANISPFSTPKIKKSIDGHYFTVFFPYTTHALPEDTLSKNYPWLYVVIVVIVLLVFFAFSVTVIIQQKRMSEVRADFVNNMTHELKTPISTIGLSAEMLKSANFSTDQQRIRHYIGLIYSENNRLKKQVERVLNMARLDKNDLDLKREEIDIHQLIDEVTNNCLLNQAHTGVEIKNELNAKSSVVNIDSVHFTNVFLNLLDNAIKYSKSKPQITISTIDKDKGIQISVTDKGIGIGKQEMKQIFDQFYRVNTGNVHDVKGFGLGLYYVQLIVNKHKGKISVHSKLDKGSTFKIWLPHYS